MSRRQFLYEQLMVPELRMLHGGRVIQRSALREVPKDKPFVVYNIGNNTDEDLAENHPANRTFFQVYIHGDKGTYAPLDDLGDLIRDRLRGSMSPPEKIITTRFLERSQDLSDDVLHTIYNYLRFQWILSG